MPTPAIVLSGTDLWLINGAIAFMLFGVALNLTPGDFRRVLDTPRAPLAGLSCQFVVLPMATALAVWALRIEPGAAVGMLLVASCPGGAYSNVLTWLARGSVALSVSMTAVSSVAALVLTPLNFALWTAVVPQTRGLMTAVRVDPFLVLAVVTGILGLPIACGMLVRHRFPDVGQRTRPLVQVVSVVFFVGVVLVAVSNNTAVIRSSWLTLLPLIVGHNALALVLGWGLATAASVSEPDRRAITIEVGIQNSALALVLLLTFLPDMGTAVVIAALWGVWHAISGLALTWWWTSRQPALAVPSP